MFRTTLWSKLAMKYLLSLVIFLLMSTPAMAICQRGLLIDHDFDILKVKFSNKTVIYQIFISDVNRTALWKSLDTLEICDSNIPDVYTVINQAHSDDGIMNIKIK